MRHLSSSAGKKEVKEAKEAKVAEVAMVLPVLDMELREEEEDQAMEHLQEDILVVEVEASQQAMVSQQQPR